ncbi:Rho GTPase activator [Niveomyces insectorum RCEF 264]|uniref:Rho GTPase activator n=1 Tax=Niveomyces insectorum RCEF 264 TaxID=1081102 RepID=A0A167M5N2_9HYPO|nr:Rho GTPase activator [Niveomyces insectorum RCEF 264]
MGRKPAPQPLAFSGAALPSSDHRLPETRRVAVSPSDSQVQSKSSTSPPVSPLRFTDEGGSTHTQTVQQPVHIADLVQQPLDNINSLRLSPSANVFDYSPHAHEEQQQASSPPYPPQQPNQLHQQLHKKQNGQVSSHASNQGRHRQPEDKTLKSNFFFHFGKSTAAKSTDKLAPDSASPRRTNFIEARDGAVLRAIDLPLAHENIKYQDSSYTDNTVQKAPTSSATAAAAIPPRSEASLASSTTEVEITPSARRGKQKTFGRLGRTRSIRDENGSLNPLDSNADNPHRARIPSSQEATSMRVIEQPDRAHEPVASLKTAPLTQHDRAFREMMSSSARNHSADRAHARDVPGQRDGHRGERDREHARTQPSSLRDNGGYTFFNGLKNSSSRAADIISKGLFGKNARSGSTTERELVVDDEHYVLKLINRPLVEQTRLTRISKRLEDSRDRTEFWMPAFPWRAIDYLNYKGTDVEGLYRVPGSGPQIKKWQRKFDEDYDVDLFAQDDLYDINIIGSMLKAWLRELPDELFPKDAQERIARECAGAVTVPQMLVDELSNLSPFNYYLLFAITCHLSLLLAHSDKNKMDFRNLCICFQPCMKIDAFSFKFLVCDWRDCWKGCVSEPRYIEEEYALFDMPAPTGIGALYTQQQPRQLKNDVSKSESFEKKFVHDESTVTPQERNVSSSDSSKQSFSQSTDNKARLKKKSTTTPAVDGSSVVSNSTLSTTLTVESQRAATPPRQSGDLRPLSPIKPLSPLGF